MKAQRSRNSEDGAGPASRLRMGAIGYTGLVALQIVYGALTAGLRAGKMFNTFPLMAGSWVPLPLFNHEPFLMNFLANPAGVQFVHRAIGWIVLLGAAVLWLGSRRISLTVNQRRALGIIAATATVQFGLGIVTLLSFVNLHVAVAHQTGAFILFALSLYLTHSLTRGRATAPASTGGSNLVKA